MNRVSARDTDWDGVRLHVVTGKGGVGKTTVAAALALALAAGGRNVLLVEVEGRQGIAQLFDCPPLPYEERKVAIAPDGGDVYALAVDTEEALIEYLEMFYNLKRAGKAMSRLGVVDFVTTIAPGLRDVILTGKTSEAVRRKRPDGSFVYDAVVMDAPPTGRITKFLNVSEEVSGLAKVGPVRNHADMVMRVVRSPETAVHFVTLLEEMPVQETLDGIQELKDVGLPVGGVIINMEHPPMLDAEALAAAAAGRLDADEIVRGLKAAGLEHDAEQIARVLAAEAADHARRMALQAREKERLAALPHPKYVLPLLPDGVDLAGLYDLADALREQGAA
ncbi:Anion-transporting ATPase [Thermomonospora curvata DSM 43183]|uniref:Anion-transporting ATPase n=1 Tax=Thermomonospora curvata (strain ATCC 19995 / DSM 43183 / JCM 3096 / KCTC 9072 / NBRC 15933 / NCIMB 10081 / Henssen B9) TaxID=471852 RepID=D1A8C5_THECD|nr:Anion-transporting ATPase [Thermomonospora curvata DSM 43183]